MAWSRTLAELVTDVTDRADIAGMVSRYPSDTVRRRVVESYRAMRQWMLDAGTRRFMSPLPVVLNPGSATAIDYGVQYRLVTAGGVVLTKPQTVEVYLAGRWRELIQGVVQDVYQMSPQTSTEPQMWIYTGYTGEPTDANAANETIFIIPTTVTTYPVRVWASALMNVADADGTTLVLDGPGFDWIIWDVVIKIVAKDNDAQNTYTIAMTERDKAEKAIRDLIRTEIKSKAQRRDVFQLPRRRRGYYTTW